MLSRKHLHVFDKNLENEIKLNVDDINDFGKCCKMLKRSNYILLVNGNYLYVMDTTKPITKLNLIKVIRGTFYSCNNRLCGVGNKLFFSKWDDM